MPKSNKSTPKKRQTPYLTPQTPANPNPRSTPTAPRTRSFAPPRFASTFPHPGFPQTTLTPFQLSQSIEQFCRDLQNGTQRAENVDEDGTAGTSGIPNVEGDGEGAFAIPEVRKGSGTRREGGVEEVHGNYGVGSTGEGLKTPNVSEGKGEKETVYPPLDKGQNQPLTGYSRDLPPVRDSYPPEQYPDSPEESLPICNLAPPTAFEEEHRQLAELLIPIMKFNAETPWPVPFQERNDPTPPWHADCPDGYEPTTLAGYLQRRQYPTNNAAAFDADIIREEYGHSCLDLDEWDRCCMSKCGGCEICRPGITFSGVGVSVMSACYNAGLAIAIGYEGCQLMIQEKTPWMYGRKEGWQVKQGLSEGGRDKRSDLSIPVPGVGKHFEMHPSGPSVNPATRMPPPTSTIQDDKNRSHTQRPDQQSSQDEEVNSSTSSIPDEQSRPTLPVVPQEQDHSDASQSSSQVRTPEDASQSQPDSISSPTRHKRTASGLLKAVDTPNDQRPRAESVSSAGSKAGEVAAQLKTRLAYAMVKVQHGWEHRNINEVEQLAAALRPRVAASPPVSSAPIDIISPPSKRRSGAGMVSWSLPDSSPVVKSSSQNSHIFRRPSASSPPAQVPSTPKSRPPHVRTTMPTQQAEQDAMDALMLMGGSPGKGGKFGSQSSSQQALQSQSQSQSQSQQNWQSQGSAKPLSRYHPDSPTATERSPKRPAILSRNNSSTSEVSVADSEVREARERVLDEVEEAA